MNAKSSTNASKSAKARKTGSPKKPATKKTASGKELTSSTPTKKGAEASLQERIEEAKKLEAIDRADAPRTKAGKSKSRGNAPARAKASAAPLRNSNFPETYIKEILVKLDDPDHPLTLKWTGSQAAEQDSGPFRGCPGAGLKGLNCDVVATSRRSGSKCTPKGTFPVSGFQSRLNSDSRATYVTWFVRARGIALHYFPSVPKYAASHGCVRIEKKSVAQLIQSNSRIGLTNVVIDGTWTKPAKQW
jgi:hypothetical protein